RVAPERGMVPGRGEPVLDAEGARDPGRGAERRARGVRSRARGVQKADRRIARPVIARLNARLKPRAPAAPCRSAEASRSCGTVPLGRSLALLRRRAARLKPRAPAAPCRSA